MEWVGEEEIKEVTEVLKSGYLYRYGVSVGDRIDPRFKGKVLQCEKEITALHAGQVWRRVELRNFGAANGPGRPRNWPRR
jgi:hypothetical protein